MEQFHKIQSDNATGTYLKKLKKQQKSVFLDQDLLKHLCITNHSVLVSHCFGSLLLLLLTFPNVADSCLL